MPRSRPRPAASTRFHIDKRARQLLAADNDLPDDDILTTAELAEWLKVSVQWLEIGRSPSKKRKPYGPPFLPFSPRCIRYTRGAVREWLRERARAYEAWLEQKASALANKQTDGLPADHAKRAKAAVAVADSEVDLHAAMRALERRCRALELELQAAKKHKLVAKREAP